MVVKARDPFLCIKKKMNTFGRDLSCGVQKKLPPRKEMRKGFATSGSPDALAGNLKTRLEV